MGYYALKGEKQDKFYDKHNNAITTFVEAHKYMTRILNGRKSIPLDEWKREYAGLITQRDVLMADSDKLATELRSAETIKRFTDKLMGADEPVRKRSYDLGM